MTHRDSPRRTLWVLPLATAVVSSSPETARSAVVRERAPGTTVTNLLEILGVTKQSLNRVLRTLIEDGLVESRVGKIDKRERNLFLTEAGIALEARLSDAQRTRMRATYREAGPEAVAGFRKVLEAMMDAELHRKYQSLREGNS